MNIRGALIGLGAVILGCVGLVAQGAQVPSAAPQTPAAPIVRTASISGRIVDSDSNEPVIGAVVRLQMRTLAVAGGRGARGAGAPGGAPLTPAEMNAANGTMEVMVDGGGRFVFHDLPKGPVQLSVSAPGYVDNGRGVLRRPPVLEDGQHASDITLALAKVASISGVITDEAGEPLVGISVRAMLRTVPTGAPTYRLTGDARTDDRGQYRIDGLFPGKYFVLVPQTPTTMPVSNLDKAGEGIGAALSGGNAFVEALTGGASNVFSAAGVRVNDQFWQLGMGPAGTTSVPPPVNGRVATYQTTFFPGATQLAQAGVITVRSGEDRAGVDWQLHPTASARVSGVLTGPDGPASNISIRLVTAPGSNDDDALPVAMTTTAADGAFTFMGVPSGAFVAKAEQSKGASAFSPAMFAGLPPEAMQAMASLGGRQNNAEMNLLRAPVAVGDRDVTGLAWLLRPGAHVSGRVIFEGSAPQPTPQQWQAVQVSFGPMMPGAPGLGGQATAKPSADGQFRTNAQAPGTYTVNVTGIPAAWMLKTVTVGGRDVTTSGIDVADVDISDMLVTYTDRISGLTGTVRGDSTGPLPNVMLFVIPSDYRSGISTGAIGRRQVTQAVPATGVYNIARLAPGDYIVAAVLEDAISGDRDQSFYDALARAGKTVTIVAGEKATLNLSVTVKLR